MSLTGFLKKCRSNHSQIWNVIYQNTQEISVDNANILNSFLKGKLWTAYILMDCVFSRILVLHRVKAALARLTETRLWG
jgi:hypothetical protein